MMIAELLRLSEELGWMHSGLATGTVLFTKPGKRFEVTIGGRHPIHNGLGDKNEVYSVFSNGTYTGLPNLRYEPPNQLNDAIRKALNS